MTIKESEIAAAARGIALVVHGRPVDLVNFRQTSDGCPFVEVRDGVIHHIVRERGRELHHATYDDLDEFMYQIALDATSGVAGNWELEHRGEWPRDHDTRIGWAAKQLQLMKAVNPAWAERLRSEIPSKYSGITLEDVDAHPVDS
ncbi:Imm63 family immunity protein [Streptomyces alanosinicus]|uniref:Immunity protein 63 domain-containing protein n=1 Tax=Streptomyces alanosinicus TaxID=68171 RepID=A0A918YC73_9ACTN|nr:Imm63 family immunity protein [Streptomyces alanosinicus]GHD98646.1 hypothetical protein GCM10010339_06650 [Streptomyces alanosinicus]